MSNTAVEFQVLETLLVALGVDTAAKPYLDKIAAMNASGASAEDVMTAIRNMRTAAETDAQASIDKTP